MIVRHAWSLAASVLLSCASTEGGEAPRVYVTEGVGLYVHQAGAGERVLVVPGAAWMDRDLDPLLEHYRVVFYDPRGRGRSTVVEHPEDLSLARVVADLEALRQELELERISLLGWSYNAAIAVRYALAHPDRVERLVLIAPFPPRRAPHWDEVSRRFAQRANPVTLARIDDLRRSGEKRRDPHGYARIVTAAFFRTHAVDPDRFTDMKSDPFVSPNLDPDRIAEQGRWIVSRLGEWDWREELATLDRPTLLVHGMRDVNPTSISSDYVTVLPDARLLLLEETGHLPWIERPDRFFPPVIAFLE